MTMLPREAVLEATGWALDHLDSAKRELENLFKQLRVDPPSLWPFSSSGWMTEAQEPNWRIVDLVVALGEAKPNGSLSYFAFIGSTGLTGRSLKSTFGAQRDQYWVALTALSDSPEAAISAATHTNMTAPGTVVVVALRGAASLRLRQASPDAPNGIWGGMARVERVSTLKYKGRLGERYTALLMEVSQESTLLELPNMAQGLASLRARRPDEVNDVRAQSATAVDPEIGDGFSSLGFWGWTGELMNMAVGQVSQPPPAALVLQLQEAHRQGAFGRFTNAKMAMGKNVLASWHAWMRPSRRCDVVISLPPVMEPLLSLFQIPQGPAPAVYTITHYPDGPDQPVTVSVRMNQRDYWRTDFSLARLASTDFVSGPQGELVVRLAYDLEADLSDPRVAPLLADAITFRQLEIRPHDIVAVDPGRSFDQTHLNGEWRELRATAPAQRGPGPNPWGGETGHALFSLDRAASDADASATYELAAAPGERYRLEISLPGGGGLPALGEQMAVVRYTVRYTERGVPKRVDRTIDQASMLGRRTLFPAWIAPDDGRVTVQLERAGPGLMVTDVLRLVPALMLQLRGHRVEAGDPPQVS